MSNKTNKRDDQIDTLLIEYIKYQQNLIEKRRAILRHKMAQEPGFAEYHKLLYLYNNPDLLLHVSLRGEI
jgi:hypothetical protein